MSLLSRKIGLALPFLFLACQPFSPTETIQPAKDIGPQVVYGEDNRIEFHEIRDSYWKDMADSSVALFNKDKLKLDTQKSVYNVQAKVYGKNFLLCQDEPFYTQPTASFCSGFLVGPDIVITAGHCIRTNDGCKNARFVFGYHYGEKNQNPKAIPKKNVYNCKERIFGETNSLTGVDYAIVRLTRKVKDRTPLLMRSQGRISTQAQLSVIGYPSGLPGKFSDQGQVRSNDRAGYFVTTLDTFGGNSGSAVLNSRTGLVEGILVRGDDDFAYDRQDRCWRANVCPKDGCRGEEVTRIGNVLDHLTPADLQRGNKPN